jgi:hypothetical protein
MDTQIIDDPTKLRFDDAVVSSSLPAWLAFNIYNPACWPVPAPPPVTLYPSFLVPDNIKPPYGVVHVLPETTQALQSAAVLGPTMTRNQLATEKVRLTFYGLRNDEVLSFLDAVGHYTLDTNVIGIMNMVSVRDERVAQSELSILAQKKTVDYEVNYNQTAIRRLSRDLIKSAFVTYIIESQVTVNNP